MLGFKWNILYEGKQNVPLNPKFIFSNFQIDQKKFQGFKFQGDLKQFFVCLFVCLKLPVKEKNQLFTLLSLGGTYRKCVVNNALD